MNHASFVCVVLAAFSRSICAKPKILEAGCGIANGYAETSRIVGGYDVGYEKYPWYAALVRGQDEVYCGATLIGPGVLVTAAHCFRQWMPGSISGITKLEDVFRIYVGMHNRCGNDTMKREFRARKVHVHEKYEKEDPYYDIALIELAGDTTGLMPSCLPAKALDDGTRGKEGIVMGLGNLQYGNSEEPCKLKEARVLVYNDQVCKKMLKEQEEDPEAFVHAFCAGYLEGKIDACQGDSGGPLMIRGTYGEYVLLGVTSFGFKCAEPGVLGLYTDVSHFRDWVREKTGNVTDILYVPKLPGSALNTSTTPKPSTKEPVSEGPGDYDDEDSDFGDDDEEEEEETDEEEEGGAGGEGGGAAEEGDEEEGEGDEDYDEDYDDEEEEEEKPIQHHNKTGGKKGSGGPIQTVVVQIMNGKAGGKQKKPQTVEITNSKKKKKKKKNGGDLTQGKKNPISDLMSKREKLKAKLKGRLDEVKKVKHHKRFDFRVGGGNFEMWPRSIGKEEKGKKEKGKREENGDCGAEDTKRSVLKRIKKKNLKRKRGRTHKNVRNVREKSKG